MKKIVLVLAILVLAAPAMGRVDIKCTSDLYRVVTVRYDSSEPNKIRAFALDITCDAGVNITAVNNVDPNFWVYPGSIDINSKGGVESYGEVVCDGNYPGDGYPGTLPGLDTNGVTVEMGSLYVGSSNAPSSSGILMTFKVDDDCTVDIVKNVIRGGVVMEDADDSVDVNLAEATGIKVECIPSNYADYATWGSVGRPDCWSDTFHSGRQCHGDADGNYYPRPVANEDKRKWVTSDDLSIMITGWQKKRTEMTEQQFATAICADFDHNYYPRPVANEDKRKWITSDDLSIMISNWQKKVTEAGVNVDANCISYHLQ